jgi:hypothetical protein
MNRLIGSDFRASIAEAWRVVPERIGDRLRFAHFVTGSDPVWIGLEDDLVFDDGRPLIHTSHCSYPWHTNDRSTTIVLAAAERERFVVDPSLVVHEIGHVLDYALGFSHTAQPVSDYAKVNRQEAFAESFRAWIYWHGDQDAFMSDLPTRALFESLS